MANGHGTRWGGHLGTPKHLLTVDGETLLERIVRQVGTLQPSAEIIISSSNPRYETAGAERHVPVRNEIEIDRFVPELITDDVCFLYGDTYYENSAIETIVDARTEGLHFFGDQRAIVAVTTTNELLMRQHFARVRDLYLAGAISKCIGWQLYQSYANLPFGPGIIDHHFTVLENLTSGFNTPQDYELFIRQRTSLTTPVPARPVPERMSA